MIVLGVGVSMATFVSFMGLANNLKETLENIYEKNLEVYERERYLFQALTWVSALRPGFSQ